MTAWAADALARIATAAELEIGVQRPDGTARRTVPIWVVTVADQVYVRCWHRRDTGWFGAVLVSARAHVRVPGAAADVTISTSATSTAASAPTSTPRTAPSTERQAQRR